MASVSGHFIKWSSIKKRETALAFLFTSARAHSASTQFSTTRVNLTSAIVFGHNLLTTFHIILNKVSF